MDPQSANNLDPKLKETYDRVMGTTTQPAVAPAAGAAVQPAPAVTAPVPTPVVGDVKGTLVPSEVPQSPNSSAPATPYTADNLSFQAAIQTPVANAAPVNNVAIPQPPSSLLKMLYIVGGIVFFVVYTIVWVKIFNLPLPF